MQRENSNWSKLEIKKVGKSSVLTESFIKKPLKVFSVQRGNASQIVFSNYGGGYVEGDQILLSLECLSETKTLLSSQANTRIYKSENGLVTRQEMEVRQGEDSFLVYLGDAIVPQRHSIFEQRFFWKLGHQAVALFVDWFEAGRILNGERFTFTSFGTELKVEDEHKTLVLDRFRIEPDKTNVNSPGAFLDHGSYMNIFLLGNEDLPRVKLLEGHLRAVANTFFQEDKTLRMNDFLLVGSIVRVNEKVLLLRCSTKENDLLVPFIREVVSVLEDNELLGFHPLERKY